MANNQATDGPTRVTSHVTGVERIHPDGIPVFYANNVGFRISVWDFALDFGMMIDANDERILVRDAATVIMSPQHAKVFSEVLARNVKNYEEQFGELKVSAAPQEDVDQ
ncbi:MAG: hypothetical protein QOJ59_1825 [Thermomicrobiales bacterium]|jgi:hypothetical protein|nr:hypothetical protein [Thermomicrobiales bacterium]